MFGCIADIQNVETLQFVAEVEKKVIRRVNLWLDNKTIFERNVKPLGNVIVYQKKVIVCGTVLADVRAPNSIGARES
jgi:hypothetical protein